MPTPLAELKQGTEAVVREVEGGVGLRRRLEAMGIRPGARIVMATPSFFRGPVAVRLGNAQIALGHGMARRILVDRTDPT
jgi:ferrous iron transport protein A